MNNHKQKLIENKIFGALISASGWAGTLLVFIIIIFLFGEGLSLFQFSPIDRELKVGVHRENPINKLSEAELRQILDNKLITWDSIAKYKAPIYCLHVNNLEKKLKDSKKIKNKPEEVLGKNYEHLTAVLDTVLLENKGAILIFQDQYLPKHIKIIELEKISLFHFLFGKEWLPTESPSPYFGVLPLLWGTLLVTLYAILFTLLLGPPVAIYLAELASPRVRNIIKPLVELLSGIPSVVFGFIGLVVVVPYLRQVFDLQSGGTVLAGSMLLSVIALPTVISVTEDALRATPLALKQASFALGATHWQTIYKVVIPYSRTGIIAAFILGIGRIVGETMVVLMVTGNKPNISGISPLEPVRAMSATIAAEMGEAPQGGLHYKSLFAVGCLLFFLTFIINFIGEALKSNKRG